MPLEKVRLATVEELASGNFIMEAIQDLETELQQAGVRAEIEDQADDEASADEYEPTLGHAIEDKETDRMKLEKRLLTDVPLQFSPTPPAGEPSNMPFAKKQRMFESLSKQQEPPTLMQEAQMRHQLETANRGVREAKNRVRSVEPPSEQQAKKPRGKESSSSSSRARAQSVGLVSSPEAHQKDGDFGEEVNDVNFANYVNAVLSVEQMLSRECTVLDDILLQETLWSEPSHQARHQQLEDHMKTRQAEDTSALIGSKLVTGKERLEYK